MSDFVADCRREWKRLRVPDAAADEMAADLAADLSEAAAEGVSAEEVLGPDALDPRSFAASWAAERGLTDPRSAGKRRTGSLALAAIAVLSAAAIAAGATMLATPSATASAPPDPISQVDSGPDTGRVAYTVRWIDVGRPGVHAATVALKRLPEWVPSAPPSEHSTGTDAFAWALLVAGIVGVALTTVCRWMVSRRRRATQHGDTDERAASYA